MYATWEDLTPSHVMALPDKYGSGAYQEIYGFLYAKFQEKHQASRVFDDSTEWKLNATVLNRIGNTYH